MVRFLKMYIWLSFLSKIMLRILIVKTTMSISCLLEKQTKEYVPIVYASDFRQLTSVQRNPLSVHEPFGNYALNLKYGLALKWNHENLHSTKFPWNGSISSVEDAQTMGWNDLWKIICFLHTGLWWAFQASSKKSFGANEILKKSSDNPNHIFLGNYLMSKMWLKLWLLLY